MQESSFRVYIDESGDEGFVFRPDGSGSSRWLILSAVVVRKKDDLRLVRALEAARVILKREPRSSLHFCRLKHDHRLPYLRTIAAEPIETVSVLIHKPSIRRPENFQGMKHLLYRYASRLLLERVSWCCREQHDPEAKGGAEVVFSNRAQMSYDDLRGYLRVLQGQETTIDWDFINPELVRAVEHSKLAGLQVADAVASSLYAALNPNSFGDVESRYSKLLRPTFHRSRSGQVLSHGLKFWPGAWDELVCQVPALADFAREVF